MSVSILSLGVIGTCMGRNSGVLVLSTVTVFCTGTVSHHPRNPQAVRPSHIACLRILCPAIQMYYVHQLQTAERKEMRKRVEVEIIEDRLKREAMRAAQNAAKTAKGE